MTADQNFYDIHFTFFYPTASATAEGENCAYGPTLIITHLGVPDLFLQILICILELKKHGMFAKHFHTNCNLARISNSSLCSSAQKRTILRHV